jgi:hypothetical protein
MKACRGRKDSQHYLSVMKLPIGSIERDSILGRNAGKHSLRFQDVPTSKDYVASNKERVLCQGIIPDYVWKDRGKLLKPFSRASQCIDGILKRIRPHTKQTRCRSANLLQILIG